MSSCGTFLRWRELNPSPYFFNLLIMKGYFKEASIMCTRRAHGGHGVGIPKAIILNIH